jgi:hypothetical protein
MSWKPILNLGIDNSKIKSGKNLSSITTVTFATPYPDANYSVSLTPYVESVSNSVPQAWVIVDSLTPSSFMFNSVGASGVFWTTYSMS